MGTYGANAYGATTYGGRTSGAPVVIQNKRSDIQTIIDEQGEDTALIKVTETTDGYGSTSGTTEDTVFIRAVIQRQMTDDLERQEVGEQGTGVAVGYFKHQYTYSGNQYEVQKRDKVKDSEGVTWKVEEIEDTYVVDNFEIYRKATLRRLPQ